MAAIGLAGVAITAGATVLVAVVNKKTGKAADTMAASSQDMSASVAELKGIISGAVSEFRSGLDRHEKKIDRLEAWQVEHLATRHGGRRKKAA